MALTSRINRAAAVGVQTPTPSLLPSIDAIIDEHDRRHLAYSYAFWLAATLGLTPATRSTGLTPATRSTGLTPATRSTGLTLEDRP
jgi:hypothetical protein